MNYGYSAGTGLACLGLAAFFWLILGRKLPRLTALLVLSGVALLITTWAGKTAQGFVGKANALIDSFTVDLVDSSVAGLIALFAAMTLGALLWQKKVDWLTLGLAALVPLAARSATGDFGEVVRTVIEVVVDFFGSIVGTLAGTEK